LTSRIKGRIHPEGLPELVVEKKFGPKMEDITNGHRKLLNGDLRNLYFNSDFTRTIKMRSMSSAEDLAENPEE